MVICTAHRARDVAKMRLLLCAVLSHALVAPITRAPQRSTHLRAPPRRGTPLRSRLDDADALGEYELRRRHLEAESRKPWEAALAQKGFAKKGGKKKKR